MQPGMMMMTGGSCVRLQYRCCDLPCNCPSRSMSRNEYSPMPVLHFVRFVAFSCWNMPPMLVDKNLDVSDVVFRCALKI